MSGTTKKGQTIKATSSAAAISNGNTYSPISSYASTDFDDKEDSASDTREDSILTRLKDTLDLLSGQLSELQKSRNALEQKFSLSETEIGFMKCKYNHLLEEHYNFKKDVRSLLGMESPPSNLHADPLSTGSGLDINHSFRAVIEQISNPLDPLLNHNFQHFMVQYAKWKNYKGRGGSLSLYGYVHKSPAVFAVFLRMAKSFDSSFEFNQITNDDSFLRQLMASVFFATGFDITAFASLIKSKKMTTFSIQNVAQYAFDISSIIDLLIDQLEDLLTPDLWEVVCNFAHPPAFQKFSSRRCPSNRNKFQIHSIPY